METSEPGTSGSSNAWLISPLTERSTMKLPTCCCSTRRTWLLRWAGPTASSRCFTSQTDDYFIILRPCSMIDVGSLNEFIHIPKKSLVKFRVHSEGTAATRTNTQPSKRKFTSINQINTLTWNNCWSIQKMMHLWRSFGLIGRRKWEIVSVRRLNHYKTKTSPD